MLGLPDTPAEKRLLLIAHWRLIAIATAVQLIGGVVSALHIEPYGALFVDAWVGAVMATLPGLLVGLAWHLASAERRTATSWPFVAFVTVISLMLLGFALTTDLTMFVPSPTAP